VSSTFDAGFPRKAARALRRGASASPRTGRPPTAALFARALSGELDRRRRLGELGGARGLGASAEELGPSSGAARGRGGAGGVKRARLRRCSTRATARRATQRAAGALRRAPELWWRRRRPRCAPPPRERVELLEGGAGERGTTAPSARRSPSSHGWRVHPRSACSLAARQAPGAQPRPAATEASASYRAALAAAPESPRSRSVALGLELRPSRTRAARGRSAPHALRPASSPARRGGRARPRPGAIPPRPRSSMSWDGEGPPRARTASPSRAPTGPGRAGTRPPGRSRRW